MTGRPDIAPWVWGIVAAAGLLSLAYVAIGGLQGFESAADQIRRFVGYRVALAVGFGVIVGLTVKVRRHRAAAVGTTAAAGGTSATAMLACCSHYLPGLIPLAAVGGLASFIGRYEEPIFVAGLVANTISILHMARMLRRMNQNPS